MSFNLKSTIFGFAGGLAVAAAAAQAAQTTSAQPQAEHPHPQTAGQMQHGQMMNDPAMRQQMMERMRQCHDTMSMMMMHMGEMDKNSPAERP